MMQARHGSVRAPLDVDPRVWVVLTCAFSVGVLCMSNPLAVGLVWVAALALYLFLGGSLSFLGRCLGVLGIMYALIVICASLVFDGTADVCVAGPVGLSFSGFVRGVVACTKLMAMVVFSLILTCACSSAQLSDALMALLRPLGRFGFPAGSVAVMLGLALRCIPLACESMGRLAMAQNARGAAIGTSRNPIRKVLSYVPLMVPLCVSMFRYADDFAFALEAKGFAGGDRCLLHLCPFTARDWAILLAGCATCLALACLF